MGSAWGNVAPEFTDPGPTAPLRQGGAAHELDLRALFRDPDVLGTVARISMRLGTVTKTVDVALFDQDRPITVANFLAYVNAGRYAANFIHRSVPGFVVQGGGFAWNAAGSVDAVATFPKILNEPGISNLRGTIAMAKVGGDPDSATSQWFINLADNSANLDAQNGGFTVFGRVLGSGMNVVDEVAALPLYNAGSPFDSLPLKDYLSGNIQRVQTVETNVALVSALSFTATSSDPELVGVNIANAKLQFTPSATRAGTVTVTLRATDLDGAMTEATLTVSVLSKAAGWHVDATQADTFAFDAANGTPLAEDPVPVSFGLVGLGANQSRTFTIRNDGTVVLPAFTIVSMGAQAADFGISDGGTQSTLAPGASTTFTVAFAPAGTGARNAVFRIGSADPDGALLELALSGTGVDETFPTLTPASPQTLSAGVKRTAQAPDWRGGLVVAADNVGVTSFTQDPAPGAALGIGEYPLIFSARDAAGHGTTVQTTLTVAFDSTVAPATTVAVARGGAPVPVTGSTGLPGGSVLSAFGTPAISDFRDLAARVTISAGRSKLAGIYWEDEAGQNKLVAWQGQASGVPGGSFKSFRDPLLAPGGAVAFGATLSGLKATEDEGIWTDLFGMLAPVLREGHEIPGHPGLKVKSITSVSMTDDALLVLAKLGRVPGAVTAASDTALFRITSPSAATLLARTGADFEGSAIKQLSVLQPAARSAGQGRWHGAEDTVAKLALQDRRTVLARLQSDGTPSRLLQTTVPDPNFSPKLATLSLPALGGDGVAVLATKAMQSGVTAANNSVLLYAEDGATFVEAVHEEAGAGKFVTFSDPVANDQGEILFFGTARAPAPHLPNTTALWLTEGAFTAPESVAKIGGLAVDAGGIPLADTAWKVFTSFALPDGPGAGPVFIAQVSGKAVKPQSNLGLWAADSSGAVRLLLRTGTDVPFPGGSKRLTGFTLLNALPGSFGARRSYNATGALAVQATFLDHSQAILRVDVP